MAIFIGFCILILEFNILIRVQHQQLLMLFGCEGKRERREINNDTSYIPNTKRKRDDESEAIKPDVMCD